MHFGTSEDLDWRFNFAPSGTSCPVIFPLVKLLSGSEEDVNRLAAKSYRNGELEELNIWAHRVVSATASTSIAMSAKKFWAAQALAVPVFSREPLAEEPPDLAAIRMLQVGADSLFELGYPQFQKLNSICQKVVGWFKAHPEYDMVLLESPLGNCVPVAVLHALAKNAGLKVSIVVWNSPRNDRPAAGYTVLESAKIVASSIDKTSMVVFIDDAITGTRFVKTYEALRKVLRGRLLPIAMVFPNPNSSQAQSAQLDRVKTRTSKAAVVTGYSETLVEMPPIPSFQIDDGLPVLWNSPVIWGETDLIAGKRKVNLLFTLLEHLVVILKDLARNGNFVRYLEKAWQRNTDGDQFQFSHGLLQNTFSRLISEVKLDDLVKTLENSGRQRFPDDFSGSILSISQTDVKERWEWFRSSFLSFAESKLKSEEAYLLWRAFDNTYGTSHLEVKPRPSRDHAYAAYAIRYNKTLRSFHERLVVRITKIHY